MITISEVKTKKDIKDFIEFPLELYKSCPYFVPPLYSDEKKLLLSGGNSSEASSIFFLAKPKNVSYNIAINPRGIKTRKES
jgi:hypothetical protein